MRIAYFSPLPPAKSGIADYSAALLARLKALAEVQVFDQNPARFDPTSFDAIVYQLGNNPYHSFVYEAAMQHPGIVVLHEANLHHLIADVTIRRNDWEGYLREVDFDGGVTAMEYARRVKALEIGPDYDGLPMIRRVLERSRGVIAHSQFVKEKVLATGFGGRVAVIPHGTEIPEVDRLTWRSRLGIPDPTTPLIGTFGFLKPYKRIAESLRAFRRLIRRVPDAKFLLVGECHPDFHLEQLIGALDLGGSVRHIGFAAIEDFVGYMGACDIVLNLRYPTVGETSGSLHRALGLGRAVLVSDNGAFSEYPDEICLKVPVGAGEEDLIFEYLNLLTSRTDLAKAMGQRARDWVARECSWEAAAQRYVAFLHGEEVFEERAAEPLVASSTPTESETVSPSATIVTGWTGSNEYVEGHLTRLVHTLELTPPGSPTDAILEMGAYMQITPALKHELGYGTVRGCYYGQRGGRDSKTIRNTDGVEFTCEIDLFDAEKDPFPYRNEEFATVLCCELLEHLPSDPMHMMSEINRILPVGGHLVLTTPNIASLRSVSAALLGHHPGFFATYLKPETLANGDSRHNREYTAKEVYLLLHYAGFDVLRVETGPFRERPEPDLDWVKLLLERYELDRQLRGEGTYILGKKSGPVRERWPGFLYSG